MAKIDNVLVKLLGERQRVVHTAMFPLSRESSLMTSDSLHVCNCRSITGMGGE
jgi:hypothetical protein